MSRKTFIIVLLAAVAAVSCKSEFDALLTSNDVSSKYDAAFRYFNAKKYAKSAQLFESLSALTNGLPQDDTVQFYWGLSNYRYKDYYTAETNFTKFLTNYPLSPFSDEARFLRIDCLYRSTLRYELDQTPTRTAIASINQYMSEFGERENVHEEACKTMLTDLEERLDRKAYENAYIYYKMEYYNSARVAFRNILKDDADNIYREDILYYTAMSSYKYAALSVPQKQKERYMVFVDDYLNFVGEYPDSPRCKELEHYYKKAKEKI